MGNGESRNMCTLPSSQGLSVDTAGLDLGSMAKLKAKTMAKKEHVEDRLERYLRAFTPSELELIATTEAFEDELHIGMNCWRDSSKQGEAINPKDCSFKMLDSCVKNLPSGQEKGVWYAIDFGGTNFRAVRLELKGNGVIEFSQYKKSLTSPENSVHPKGLMDKHATATELFDFFAKSVKSFMAEKGDIDEHGKSKKEFGVGFTFSFPCNLRKLDCGILMVWTKDFETGRDTNDRVEGQDVGELLDMAFKRNEVPMKCIAVCNDTVGTMLSCAYEKTPGTPPCLVGVILGTGFNACYYDENCPYYNYRGNIINLECGNFNRSLPRTNIDMECDFASISNRGQQLLEKMISGAYLGEVCRRTIVKVWQHEVPEKFWQIHSLTAEDCAEMAADVSSDAESVVKVLKRNYDATLSASQCAGIRRICYAVFDRSAALAACVIAACARKSGKLQPAMGGLTVGIDGSLYKCNKFYRKRLSQHLKSVLGEETSSLITLALADDGSGKGAGIVACSA
eukprot:CAMPEP_0113844314 /NCGR_PEP_ID=MMETSP0372-20130328/176_1 /TAXON_ID=340204 /ORGANISM="Lankesteria abbotti" /LENGTH=509 /DNA_ID=CAMNT_0000813319 /DNA_START=70 /DNA_END=1599 /DNA_ORIENTATION=- /assembly_acc=CAM_ASM_000359